MYYKSVNRGLMFTKAGVYCIGYVMALGLLAIVSGVNALYLFLSTGMALLIVSGLLSEKIMRHNQIVKLEDATADAHTPFQIGFAVENNASRFTTYGIETYFLLEQPKLKMVSRPIRAPIHGRATRILPGETQAFVGHCQGLGRGLYTEIISLQKTGYPFGFLEKFKFKPLRCRLTVGPQVDQVLLTELARRLSAIKKQHEEQMEFFGHRNYSTNDSLRYVDWRRSASKAPKDWVVKQYRSDSDLFAFSVHFSSADLAMSTTEETYEKLLCRVRTAIEAVHTTGFSVSLTIDGLRHLHAMEKILAFLAGIPKWNNRKELNTYLDQHPFARDAAVNTARIEVSHREYKVVTASSRERAS